MSKPRPFWFTDRAYGNLRPSYQVKNVLFRKRSAYQLIEILETSGRGRALILDGTMQITEADEHIYHEMMAHVPLLAHGQAREILIIGGGDGGTLREVLRHPVESVTMVEIDGDVISSCRTHMPSVSRSAFEDERANVLIGDGANYLARSNKKFDIIFVDSTDDHGPGHKLYSRAFYKKCSDHLAPRGILVTQNGMPFLFPQHLRQTYSRQMDYFKSTSFYLAAIPSYFGGAQAFGWATNFRFRVEGFNEVLSTRFKKSGLKTRYYSPEVHLASFALPPMLKAAYTD